MSRYVPGSGNPHAKLMFVGEAPGKTEDENGIGFCGPAGDLLWQIANELGILRENVWTTNVYKFRPPNNSISRIREVCNPEEEVEKLWNEIRSINPNCILALGNTAFKTLRGYPGITKWRGSILTTRHGDRKIVGTIHPSNVVRDSDGFYGHKPWPYIWKYIIKSDMARALEESQFPELDLPPRYVTICRDSLQLRRFLDQNKHRSRMSTDIESINCIPVCISIAFDKHEALVIPLFNRIGPLNIGGIPSSDQSFMWQQVNDLLKEKDIIGQNFKYDQEKLEMIGFGFKYPNPIKSDTMFKAHVLIPELPSRAMEMLQSLWTKLPYHKDEGKEFNPGKDRIDKLFHYGGLDALSTFETDEEMEKDLIEMNNTYGIDCVSFYYDYYMQLHQVYKDIERIGFNVDMNAREALKIKYQSQHEMVQARFSAVIPEFKIKGKKCHKDHLINVAAHAQIKTLLYSYLGLPARTAYNKQTGKSGLSANEDTIVGLINNVAKDERTRAILTDIIEDRRVRKTLGTYVLSGLDYDGRIRSSYRVTGTETGRSSTAILRPPIRPRKSGHAFQTLTKHGEVGSDIRTMYIPDKGYVFVQFDLSQAEPRIVAVLSNDFKLQAAFESGKVDIHRRTAALVLDMMPNLDLSEEFNEIADRIPKDSGERFLGKKCRNGGNYDMGKGELALNIATDAKKFGLDVSVSEWRAGKMLDSFHRESPNIRGVFHKEIQNAINTTRVLINPYGRVRKFHERLEKRTYGEGYAHIPQSTVADHVKHSILLARDGMPDFRKMLLGEAHDALLCQFPIGEWEDRARIVRSLMQREIDFSICTLKRGKLTIPVDVEVGFENYREMKKVKI